MVFGWSAVGCGQIIGERKRLVTQRQQSWSQSHLFHESVKTAVGSDVVPSRIALQPDEPVGSFLIRTLQRRECRRSIANTCLDYGNWIAGYVLAACGLRLKFREHGTRLVDTAGSPV
jgi:hypothetical protein